MKANIRNLHRDFVVRDLVGLLPPNMADTVLRFYENDRVNSATKAELMKVADFDTRKACHMLMLDEKRPTRARPSINEGLCYRQVMLKDKARGKRQDFRQDRGKARRGGRNSGRGRGRGRPHGNGFKRRFNTVDADGKSVCNQCKKPGHMSRDCPQKHSESSGKK